MQKPIPDYRIFRGDLFEQVDDAVDFVLSKLTRSVGTRESGIDAPVDYELPPAVIAEGIVNALAHRDYSSAGARICTKFPCISQSHHHSFCLVSPSGYHGTLCEISRAAQIAVRTGDGNRMAHSEDESRFRNAERDGDRSAKLAGIDLHGVLKSCPRLNEFDLSSVNFHAADLAGAHFQKANLSHANLSHAKVTTSDFRDANLQHADLTSAKLNGAVMTGANLSNANLTNTSLVKARLNNADFTGANLDGTDLRGARGLTKSQLESAVNGNRAILDERMLASMHRSDDTAVARHGRQKRQPRTQKKQLQVDLTFDSFKPAFGDVFQLCGCDHPQFPPIGDYGFDQLADLEIKQVDDYFAICADGDPVVWIFPLVRGRVVEHHSGPFDGIRIELGDRRHSALWTNCVRRFKEVLAVTE